MRVRQPVQPGLRRGDGGAEHGPLQRRAELRVLLRDQVRRRSPLVSQRKPLHLHHRHQLLPPEPRPPLRQWRLVQPAPPPLRPRHAHVPQDRRVPRRHCPRRVPQGAVPEGRRNQVHHQRLQVLQPSAHHERRRRRRRAPGEREGLQDRMDADEPQLGAELAVQRRPRGAVHLLPRHRQRPPHLHLLERRPRRLEVRPDLLRQELRRLNAAAAAAPQPARGGSFLRFLPCRVVCKLPPFPYP